MTMTFDFSPGAQIPLDGTPHTGATAALSSGAYRDNPLEDLVKLNEETAHKAGRYRVFAPNFGEAFCQAVIARTLDPKRKPLVRSFGIDPRIVVEHCLEAEALRHQRDKQLTAVALVFGFLFLPGTLLWLGAFEFRRRSHPDKQSLFGGLALAVCALIAVLLAWHPPAHGFFGFYLRIVMLGAPVGCLVARQICLRSATQLRARWGSLIEGGAVGARVPNAVPIGPEDTKAENLRKQLSALASEQETNYLHVAHRKGVLGLGRRWAVWQLAEQLNPREGIAEIRPFHPWDVIRKIEDHLGRMNRSPLATGGFPQLKVEHWAIDSIGETADEISRPSGPEFDGSRMRVSALTDLANRQNFGRSGARHYLGVQFVLFDGGLVLTLLIRVSALHETLRIEVSGYALGPVAGGFTSKPKQPEKTAPKPGKPWENSTTKKSVVSAQEVVRLAVRAPFTWNDSMLNWLGGTFKLPEPFGLRSTWASTPWGNRNMTDDATQSALAVLRAVHAAAVEVLVDHDVDVERFKNRASLLGMEVQGARPAKPDDFDI